MPFLEISGSNREKIAIIIVSLPLGGLLLLMGVANLIYPDVPEDHLAVNTLMCLGGCFVGLILLLLAIAAFRGILHSKEDSREQNQTEFLPRGGTVKLSRR